MGRFFGLVLMLIAIYLGMTLYSEGLEGMLGSAFAPIESREGGTPRATHLTPAAQLADEPSGRGQRVWITDAVRDQVTSDLAAGASRHAD